MESETKMQTSEEQIREYLMHDLTLHKMHVTELKKKNSQWILLIMVFVFFMTCCVGAFSATMYFVTIEHTKQIQSIFGAKIELAESYEHVYQKDLSGSAILNTGNNSMNITNSDTTKK